LGWCWYLGSERLVLYIAVYSSKIDVDNLPGILYCNRWVVVLATRIDSKLLTLLSAAASTEAVSDFAIFLILATFRNLTWCTTAARTSPAAFKECHESAAALSHNPRGHVLGVIGLGNIGYEIARKAYLAFGLKIKYYDVIRKSAEKEKAIEAEFMNDLASLLAVSDCVVLATPANPDGKKVIGRDAVANMKFGSRFVNIARGSLVDEDAIADAVEEGRLVGVGMDVHAFEPAVSERLKGLRQVTLTAHNAGGTLQT
jgi:lactate dehydrogenase-like 2-hydroxyacid dehydrogenase